MDLKVKVKNAVLDKEVDKEGNRLVEMKDLDNVEFFSQIMNDTLLNEFIKDAKSKDYICKEIGVEGLLASFNKDDVLKKIGWEYVKNFYLDHVDPEFILNHFGYEKVREHFKDKIVQEKGPQIAINTESPCSVLGALDESEGKA